MRTAAAIVALSGILAVGVAVYAQQARAANVTAEFDEKWGKGFIKGPKFAEMLAKDFITRGS